MSDSLGGKRTIAAWLFNPFQFVAGGTALGIGLAVMLVSAWIGSFSNTHYDGALDIHAGLPAPLWVFTVEVLIDWACVVFILWPLGAIISRTRFRLIDLMGTQALARWPFLLVSPAALLPAFQRFAAYLTWKATGAGEEVAILQTDAVVFGLITLATLVIACWSVVLMYKAFSVSCNVRGGKAIGTFAAGLLAAEIVSKILIIILIKGAVVGVA